MEKITHFLILIIFLTIPAQSANPCKPDSCHDTNGPEVRFPFRLKGRQPARCGYGPGFSLHCNSRNQTILTLPRSGEFIVDYIDYKSSSLYIDDPGSCLPKRALNFSLAGSPFNATYLSSYGILNCSNQGMTEDDEMPMGSYVVLPCLSTRNTTVVAVDKDFPASSVPPPCRRVANVSVPRWWTFEQFNWRTMGPELEEVFQLRWSVAECGRCESRGGLCGFKDDSGLQIGCSKSSSGQFCFIFILY